MAMEDAFPTSTATAELASLPYLANKEIAAFAVAGLRTPGELLRHVPKRYEDRRRFDAFPNQASAQPVCLRGTVIDAGPRFFGRGMRCYQAVVLDGSGGVFGSGKITCRWFNMPFMSKVIATGQEVCLFGKVKDSNGCLVIDHPEIEVLGDDDESSIHLERIVPIYRNLTGFNQRRLRQIIHKTLAGFIIAQGPAQAGPALQYFHDVHFPESMEAAKAARREFALEEFFALQLNVVWQRARYGERNGRILGKRRTYLDHFQSSLPFSLTGAQHRAIHEIAADMLEPRPMNRLLQGDVGAGKTFVAMAAMLLAIDSGCQAALMAPTQILAEQHYLTFRRWLEPLGIRVSLRTGNRNELNHLEIEGPPQIVIGTHALLYDPDFFLDLGMVVIDEQHKFGVAQRAALVRQGVVPDVLVMTATPIPRTLTMTIYGDLDVSILDEKPAGRGKIITAVRVSPKQNDVTKFVKQQLAEGRQAYLVYPLVEESESTKAESATEAYTKWQKRLAGHEVGLIHGKLRPEEKEAVMRRFRDGEIAALVATTVIEVGVDVPNASLMILHHAERFGLAQLHQLRGRIGRGGAKSYCVLLTDGKNPDGVEKLAILAKTSDGFEIAEADLRLRGPGDVLGTMQSGVTDLKFAEFLTDTVLLREARDRADRIIAEDSLLTNQHQHLRKLIREDGQSTVRPGAA